MQINKYKNGLSSGWFSESQRHSNAKKYGIAGGIYANKEKLYVVEWNDIPLLFNKEEVKFLEKNFDLKNMGRLATPQEVNDCVRASANDIVDGDIDNNPKGYYPLSWKNHKKGLYYAISSISNKGKIDDIISQIRDKLSSEGIKADIYDDKGQIRLKNIRLQKSTNIRRADFTKSGIRKTNALSWDDWVKVNDSVNDVLDANKINATVSSLGGKFKIRNKSSGRFSEDDWENLKYENVGSQMRPITREDVIRKGE